MGKFLEKPKKTVNVVLGRPFEIKCPAHGFTQNAGYKWGGTSKITGTWFVQDRPNMLVLEDGRLFFSHVTMEDVKYIEQKGGIGCLLEASHDEDVKLEQSGLFELNVIGGTNTYEHSQWIDFIIDKIFKNIEIVKFITTALKSILNLVKLQILATKCCKM